MAAVPGPFACTLDEDGVRARSSQIQGLVSRLVRRQRTGDRLRLDFTDDGRTRALVEGFIRDEERCCSFFGFDVQQGAGKVVLQLVAPDGAGHMLDAAMAAFDPTLADDERLALRPAHAAPEVDDPDDGSGRGG